jgi:hypothetical protein
LFGRSVPITVLLPVDEHRVIDEVRKGRLLLLREPGGNNNAMILQQHVELIEIAAAEAGIAPWQRRLYLTVADCGRRAVAEMLEGRQWSP